MPIKKLTPKKVLAMRRLYRRNRHKWKQVDLAAKFGISQTVVSRIVRGKLWAKVK